MHQYPFSAFLPMPYFWFVISARPRFLSFILQKRTIKSLGWAHSLELSSSPRKLRRIGRERAPLLSAPGQLVNVLPAIPILGETRIMFQPHITAQGRGHCVQRAVIPEKSASDLPASSLESAAVCGFAASQFLVSDFSSLSLCPGEKMRMSISVRKETLKFTKQHLTQSWAPCLSCLPQNPSEMLAECTNMSIGFLQR